MKIRTWITPFYFPFLLFSLCILSFDLFADDYSNESESSGKDTLFHNGMECCKCFIHCDCFKENLVYFDQYHPINDLKHPRKSIDLAWHAFVRGILTAKKEAPTFIVNSFTGLFNYNPSSSGRHIHSLSDYLETIETFRGWILQAKLQNIEFYKDLYSSPKEKQKLKESLIRVKKEYQKASQILNQIPSIVIPLYQEAANQCPHNCLFSVYNKGILHALECRWDDAVTDMKRFIDLAERDKLNKLDSKFYQNYGEACLELHLFHEAIDALTNVIKKDPKNKQAYFSRAAAYFETGNFDQAIQDYLLSNQMDTFPVLNKASKDFTKALAISLCEGIAEATVDFVPTLCSTTYGLSKALWATAKHPLDSTQVFANACYEMGKCFVDYCKTLDADTVNDHIDQLKTLYQNFDQLSDTEKGNLIGHTIGKYGVEIFAGGFAVGGAIKGGKLLVNGALAYRNLKNVNRAYNLEAMTLSKANKKIIAAESLKHAAEREAYFKNVKYNFDAHNKHMYGHNDFRKTGSEWQHKNPENLLRHFAGTGRPERGTPGLSGYKETIDFGEHIGIWRNKEGTIELPTTRGTIHYSKKGAHIVPANPNPIIGDIK